MAAMEVPFARRMLASLSLMASAGTFGVLAWQAARYVGLEASACAGLVAVAGVAMSRRSVVAQVLSRGVAWAILLPTLLLMGTQLALGGVDSLLDRTPDFMEIFLAATSASALLLARPALHTPAARAAFNPSGFRRTFLAGAVATATAGFVTATFALGMHSMVLGMLTTALLASAVGVARMRSWGVLLGGLTSLASMAAALMAREAFEVIALALVAVPGTMLAATVAAARLRATSALPAFAGPTRLAMADERLPAARVRVAVDLAPDAEPIVAPARLSARE